MHAKAREPYSICYATHRLYLDSALKNPNISALITTKELASSIDETRGLVVVENPQLSYYQLHNYLVENNLMALHDGQYVHRSAQIASSVVIGDHVVVAEGVVIEHRAIIADYTVIGANTYIGENVVTSARGMQDLHVNGVDFRIKYAGGVKIGQGCQVLSGAIVQRPYQAYYTEIGDNSKISVRVVVGHGVKIGHDTMVAGSVQIAGNVTIGDDVWIGPSATIADGITIGDQAKVRVGSVVVEDVGCKEEVSGNFAVAHKRQLRLYARIKNGQL